MTALSELEREALYVRHELAIKELARDPRADGRLLLLAVVAPGRELREASLGVAGERLGAAARRAA